MSSFPCATVILTLEKGQTDLRIKETIEAFGRAQWRCEILVVHLTKQAGHFEQISYRPLPQRFESYALALKSASHSKIAILDRHESLDPDHWKLLIKRAGQFPIQACFRQASTTQRSQLNRIRHAFAKIYFAIVGFFLRTKKTELHPGTLLLNRDELGRFWNQLTSLDNADFCNDTNQTFSCMQLIAISKLNRIPVAELLVESEYSDGPPTVSTKSIRREIGTALRFWWNQIMFPKTQRETPAKYYKPVEKFAAVSVLILLAVFILFRSLNFPLFEPDEARNAQLALNIVNSGQWMSLTLAEENYWDKPPLQIWAIATSYHLFGINQFTTRLPIVIAALLTMLMTVLVGKRIVGFRAAWLGGFLLLLTTGFVCTGRYVTMDSSLTACVTAMILFGFLAIESSFKRCHILIAGIACGLGILVKGPVIVVLCAPPLLAAFWLRGLKTSNHLADSSPTKQSADCSGSRSPRS